PVPLVPGAALAPGAPLVPGAALAPGAPLVPGAPLAPGVAGCPLPPEPCLAAATPIGATLPAPVGGADWGGAPKPLNPGAPGPVVVVVEASPGQDVDPVPGAHWADGAVVVVDVAFLVVVGVVAAGAAARCRAVWGTAEFPATAGAMPAKAAVAKVAAATPSRPMLMRDIGTSPVP